MEITFKGTTEQFVDWLKGNVQQDTWPKCPLGNRVTTIDPDTGQTFVGPNLVPIAEYHDWLQSLDSFVSPFPFEPPSSLDLPLRLEIKGRIGRADPEEDGALLESDLSIIILFQVCCPVPGGILIKADYLDLAARGYFDWLLAKLRKQGWLDLDEEALERLPHPTVRKRKERVRDLWKEGLTDGEIAERLFVSESTVKRDRKEMGLVTKS